MRRCILPFFPFPLFYDLKIYLQQKLSVTRVSLIELKTSVATKYIVLFRSQKSRSCASSCVETLPHLKSNALRLFFFSFYSYQKLICYQQTGFAYSFKRNNTNQRSYSRCAEETVYLLNFREIESLAIFEQTSYRGDMNRA